MYFNQRVAFITGSSKHTGFGIAESMVKDGIAVVINSRKTEDVERACEKLRKFALAPVFEAPGDISSPGDVDRMFDDVVSRFGRLDILVNNACLQGVGYNFIDMPYQFWYDVINVNVNGLFLCSQKAVNIMKKQGKGVIINIGSNHSLRTVKDRAAYAASKGAIESATIALALDLAPYGIRVNNVVPGSVRTSRWDTYSSEDIEKRRKNIPLRMEATYEDVANAVKFLASDAAGNITGTRLVVDGGISAQLIPQTNLVNYREEKTNDT